MADIEPALDSHPSVDFLGGVCGLVLRFDFFLADNVKDLLLELVIDVFIIRVDSTADEWGEVVTGYWK